MTLRQEIIQAMIEEKPSEQLYRVIIDGRCI